MLATTRARPIRATFVAMQARERLVVEIDRDSEPISGLIAGVGGTGPHARRFHGYMELIAALERRETGRGGPMDTYAILRRGGWRSSAELREAGARSQRVGDEEMADEVRWIRTYALAEPDGSVGTVCIYQAVSPEAIREHARRAGLPCDEIIPVAETVVVRADPEPAEAA